MEDVADGLHSAWKETLQGLKVGYRKAKTALKIPSGNSQTSDRMDSNGVGATCFSHNDRRRLFQAKYAHTVSHNGRKSASTDNATLHPMEEFDSSSCCESADSVEGLSDEEVKSFVECKFFDPSYDPVAYEIEHLPQECPKTEEAIKAESALVDQKILVLKQQCDVVSTTLKKRVLAHHEAFVEGIEQLRRLNDSLLVTSSDCKKCRHAIRKSKVGTVDQLRIIAQKRGVDNCSATVRVLDAMRKMNWKRMQLRGLLRAGKIVEAYQFLETNKKIEMEEVLNSITCMKDALEEWRLYVRQPERLRNYLEVSLKNCFTLVFIKETYLNAVESTYELGSSAECCSTVEMLLWETAVQILKNSLMKMSSVKDDGASLEDIVAAIEPAHLVMCFVSMAGKLIDFLYVFKTVHQLHEEVLSPSKSSNSSVGDGLEKKITVDDSRDVKKCSAPTTSPGKGSSSEEYLLPRDSNTAELASQEGCGTTVSSGRKGDVNMVHSDLLIRISRLGPRLARDLILKLRLAVAGVSSSFSSLKVDQVIHLFVILDLLIESMVITLHADEVDVENSRKELLNMLATTIRQQFFSPKLDDLVHEMNRDSWEGCDISVNSLPVCRGVDLRFYEDQVSRIHRYLQGPKETNNISKNDVASIAGDDRFSGRGDNPFQVPPLLEPEDLSKTIERTTFGHYWGSVKVPPASNCNEHVSSPTKVSGRTVSENDSIAPPPTIIAASAIYLYQHLLMQTQLELVLRFPPLVERVIEWCEEWVSFYIFTVVDNFISISRSIPVEEQGDFSIQARKTLRGMRQSAESAVNARNEAYRTSSRLAPSTSISVTANSANASNAAVPGSTGSGTATGILSQILHTTSADPSSPTAQASNANSNTTLTLKFPPRVIDRIRALVVSESNQYALKHRVTACESAKAVVALYECVLRSFQPFLYSTRLSAMGEQFIGRCEELYGTAAESFHVCLHRLSEALLPMPKICDEISHLKPKKSEMEVSPYVEDVISSLSLLHEHCIPLPTPLADSLFIQHSIFAAQCILVREYGKISKKVNDMLAMQLQVDSQKFSQQAVAKFGTENIVRPRHVLDLVKTGFFLQDGSQSIMWMEREHTMYNAADILNWFSYGDRTVRAELEIKLKRDLQHVDSLPLSLFFPVR